jgi:hypothetical protein
MSRLPKTKPSIQWVPGVFSLGGKVDRECSWPLFSILMPMSRNSGAIPPLPYIFHGVVLSQVPGITLPLPCCADISHISFLHTTHVLFNSCLLQDVKSKSKAVPQYTMVALYPWERTLVPTGQEAGWARELVWTQRLEEKSFAPARDRTSIARSVARQNTDLPGSYYKMWLELILSYGLSSR